MNIASWVNQVPRHGYGRSAGSGTERGYGFGKGLPIDIDGNRCTDFDIEYVRGSYDYGYDYGEGYTDLFYCGFGKPRCYGGGYGYSYGGGNDDCSGDGDGCYCGECSVYGRGHCTGDRSGDYGKWLDNGYNAMG